MKEIDKGCEFIWKINKIKGVQVRYGGDLSS
jgi:hypothetical protein